MQELFNSTLLWWLGAINLPALSGLFWMIWRTRKDFDETLHHLHELLEVRCSQLREALSSFKLEVSKNYASVSDLRIVEERIISHLLRIEAKLDRTALKTEALHADKRTQQE